MHKNRCWGSFNGFSFRFFSGVLNKIYSVNNERLAKMHMLILFCFALLFQPRNDYLEWWNPHNHEGNTNSLWNFYVLALKKGRFWITPDPYHKDDNIQIGREVKISCQVEAVPSEELTFSWFKNGRPLRSSERMVITQTDPDVSPGTTNLDIIDLKFTDFGTYTCVASLKGGGISDISIDVNISSSTGKRLTHGAKCF